MISYELLFRSCSDAQQGSNTNNSQQPTVPSHDPPPIGSLGGHNSPPAYNNLHCHPGHQSLNSPPLYNQLQPSTSIQTAGNSNSFNLHDGFHPGYSMSSTATTLPSSPSNRCGNFLDFTQCTFLKGVLGQSKVTDIYVPCKLTSKFLNVYDFSMKMDTSQPRGLRS